MPFQSEKQRRFLHANHPEIAKRWEKEYAHGGISNHFRKKYSLGEGPVMEETDNMDFLSSLTQEEVDQEPEKYAQLLIGLRKPDFFMGEGANQRAYFRQPGGGSISVPWGFHASSYEQTVDFKNGGISNHFRKKFFTGALADTQQGQAMSPGTSASGGLRHTPSGNNNDNDNTPPTHPIHTGPTLAEIEAREKAKALADANAKAELEAAKHKAWIDRKDKKKKKVKHHKTLTSKFDTPEWDTDLTTFSLEDFKSTKTLEDYYRQLDETDVPLSVFEKQHMEVLENQNRLKFEDEFKEKEGISNEKLMYPPPGNLAKLSTKGLIEYNKLINKKNQNEATDGLTPSLTDKEKERLKQLEKDKESKLTTDSVTMIGAKGGVARKNYFHGGILDIDASEEIISDDGNDIELTAYNAEFDDPNDLSTGVKTLFMKKGGNVRLGPHTATDLLAKKNPDGTRSKYQPPGGGETSLGSGAAYSGGASDRGPRDDPDRFGPTTETKATPPGPDPHGGDWDKGWLDPTLRPGTQEYIEEEKKDYIEIPKHKSKLGPLGNRPKMIVTLKQAKKFAEMDKYVDEILNKFTKTGAIYAGTKFIGNQLQDLIPFIGRLMPEYFPKVNLHGEVIKDHVTGSDLGWFQDDEWDHLWGKGPDDTGDDGPEVPKVVPVHEEIDAYEDVYAMSPWDRIKANQQKRAMLVEKGIIQENPIVDESVTDITMEANKGGLANLFRVKNQ